MFVSLWHAPLRRRTRACVHILIIFKCQAEATVMPPTHIHTNLHYLPPRVPDNIISCISFQKSVLWDIHALQLQ